jgi:hypothetical protein
MVVSRTGRDALAWRELRRRTALFADAKAAEYFSQQIVAAEFAGDFP